MEENKSNLKPLKSKSRKGLILGIIFGVISPLVGGIVAGIVISKYFIGEHANYDDVDLNAIAADKESIMKKYNAIKDSNKSFIDNMKPYEMVNAAYYLYSDHTKARSITMGHVYASGVDQTIVGSCTRVDDLYLEESISKSLSTFVNIALANRTYYDANKDEAKLYFGEVENSYKGTYTEEAYAFTGAKYAELYGKTPNEPLIYIVSNKTVLSKYTTVKEVSDGIEVFLKLNRVDSVAKYSLQMKNISNLAERPAFSSVELTFTLDKDTLLIKKLVANDKYYAKTSFGVGSESEEILTITYEVDGDYTIPNYNEYITYPEGL